MKLSIPKIKKVLAFLEIKLSYISGGNFPTWKQKLHSEYFEK